MTEVLNGHDALDCPIDRRRAEIAAERRAERDRVAAEERRVRIAERERLDITAMIDARVAAHLEPLEQAVADLVAAQVKALRGEIANLVADNIALRQRCTKLEADAAKPVRAKLPAARAYALGRVHYRHDIVTQEGSTYQAVRDTAAAPSGSEDWTCLAHSGKDGASLRLRGAYSTQASYKALDVVSYERSSFVARCDSPGPVFGDGWQLLAAHGERGPMGERGGRGPRGAKGAKGDDVDFTSGFHVDAKHYCFYVLNVDGTLGAKINLRPLFEQFLIEAAPFDEY
jgi:hypothetical protein